MRGSIGALIPTVETRMPISQLHRVLFAAIFALLQTAAAAAQNTPPVAAEGHFTTPVETAVESVLPASDPDGDALTFSIATPPRKGTLVITDGDTGTFVYTPAKLESGADLFTFQVSDGQATSAVTPFAISIAEPSDNVALHRHAEVTIPGELASAPELVDGNPATSWKSHAGMSGDQGLVIDLGESRRVWRVVIHWGEEGHASAYELRLLAAVDSPAPIATRLVLFWGDAYASDYEISLSRTCSSASSVVLQEAGRSGGVDVIELPDLVDYRCRHISVLGGPGDHYELREAELYGPLADNVATGGASLASTSAGSAGSDAAIDGDLLTEWAGLPSTEPSWLLIQSRQARTQLGNLRIVWGDSYPQSYAVFIADEGGPFRPYFATNAGDGRVDFISNGFEAVRYVLVVIGPTAAGYSIREIEIFQTRVMLP